MLSHPWICGGASTTPLQETVKSLRKFNAARKLKNAAMMVIAHQRFQARTDSAAAVLSATPTPSASPNAIAVGFAAPARAS